MNDRVRKILDQSSKDAMQDIDKRSIIWRMFMSSTLEASVFMGKNYLDTIYIPSKYRRSHNETDVRHVRQIDIRTIRRDLWSE